MTNKSFRLLLIGILIGVVLCLGLVLTLYQSFAPAENSDEPQANNEPLYWVAPMDPDYRRDKPGKSPMGMDLVPVYRDNQSDNESESGLVKISPEVVNNIGVRTALAKKQKLHLDINTVGYIQYNENQLIHIHPRVQGWIEKLYVTAEGNPVEKGQPLYQLYSPELVNAQEELVLALSRKNARLIRAATDRLQALQLPEKNIQQLIASRKVSQTVTFYSPQSGVVDNLKIRQGFYVKPGTTLMSIGNLDRVWVEAEIFERQLPFINLNDSVSMTLDYIPGENWTGKIDYIYPMLDPKTRTIRIRIEFENPRLKLKPNMYAQLSIHSEADKERIVVPKEAVIRTGNQNRVVLALGDGRFKSIAVKTGQQDNRFIEVLEGIQENNKVVTSAQFLIDSESSKTTDFSRMEFTSKPVNEDFYPSAKTAGTINSIDATTRMLNISREAIEKWGRPAATFDFLLEDSINVEQFSIGQEIQFEFEVRDELLITSVLNKNNTPLDHSKH